MCVCVCVCVCVFHCSSHTLSLSLDPVYEIHIVSTLPFCDGRMGYMHDVERRLIAKHKV